MLHIDREARMGVAQRRMGGHYSLFRVLWAGIYLMSVRWMGRIVCKWESE